MKVSIITPSYNQGQFIERTLQSGASQAAVSGFDIEPVVFDGGSTDNTLKCSKTLVQRCVGYQKKIMDKPLPSTRAFVLPMAR